MITLYNVIDIRNNKFYKVAVVSEDRVKYFIESKKPVKE